MKVLFMTRKFPPSVGGMENFAYDLYQALRIKLDIKLISWGKSNKYLPVVLPYFLVTASYALIRQDIDIIHVQDGVLAPIGYGLSRLFRKPFTVVIHGLDITYNNRLFQLIFPRFVARADAVFCISQAAAEAAIKRGISKDKITIIPLGITDENYSDKKAARHQLQVEIGLDEDAPILLTVGRLVERKGVAWFIDNVMPTLHKKFPNLVYLIAGSGEYRHKIQEAIKRQNLLRQIYILGTVTNEMLANLYNGADIFVQPNIPVANNIEGFGRVLLEASLCQLPAVASGIEGIKDAVTDRQNGILVETTNSDAFINEITNLLEDTKYAHSVGRKSRQYTVKKFNWQGLADNYETVYRTILHQ